MAGEKPHPPPPGAMVSPNLPGVEAALARIPFPISKRELMERVEGETAVWRGRNVDLWELIKDLHDDYFDSEEELREQLLNEHGLPGADEQDQVEPAVQAEEADWQAGAGPGGKGSPLGPQGRSGS